MIVGIDAGGTNVDAVLLGENGIVRDVKSPEPDTSDAIEEVFERLLMDQAPSDIERVVIATTLVLNAAVEERLPTCSNLLIPGPGLSPELAFHGQTNHVLGGCVDHRGRVTEEVTFDESPEHEVVAVTSKFGTRNPDLERTVRQSLDHPEEKIMLGHEAGGRLGFPKRAATTVFNAKGGPVLNALITELESLMGRLDVEAPLYFLNGDAGMLTGNILSKTASQTARGGPAASALGLLSLTGKKNAICVDIGGTTTDIAVIEDGYPVLNQGFHTNGLYSMYRAVDSIDLPVGGDTCIDQEGLTGRREGNAAAFGGPKPTPTDALHVLGKFTEGNREAALNALEKVGDPEQVSKSVLDEMVQEISKGIDRLVQRVNRNPEHLIAGGVLAPALANALEARLNRVRSVEAPDYAHVAGAVGCAAARVSLQTHVHIDSAQGVMTVNRVGHEEKRHVTKGKIFDDEELKQLGKEEAQVAARQAGGSGNQEANVQFLRSFNVVKQGRRRGQIANITAQIVPGLDRWISS